jgi:hypothetical protein
MLETTSPIVLGSFVGAVAKVAGDDGTSPELLLESASFSSDEVFESD